MRCSDVALYGRHGVGAGRGLAAANDPTGGAGAGAHGTVAETASGESEGSDRRRDRLQRRALRRADRRGSTFAYPRDPNRGRACGTQPPTAPRTPTCPGHHPQKRDFPPAPAHERRLPAPQRLDAGTGLGNYAPSRRGDTVAGFGPAPATLFIRLTRRWDAARTSSSGRRPTAPYAFGFRIWPAAASSATPPRSTWASGGHRAGAPVGANTRRFGGDPGNVTRLSASPAAVAKPPPAWACRRRAACSTAR